MDSSNFSQTDGKSISPIHSKHTDNKRYSQVYTSASPLPERHLALNLQEKRGTVAPPRRYDLEVEEEEEEEDSLRTLIDPEVLRDV